MNDSAQNDTDKLTINTTRNVDTSKLFQTIYTKNDLVIFYKEIDQIISEMFKNTGPFEDTLSKIVSPEKKEEILSYIKDKKVQINDLVAIKVALSEIQKIGNALPVVTLVLAFEPTEVITNHLSLWFIKHYKTKVILDIQLERHLLGGAFISYNGLYKNYSLKEKVDTYFSKGKHIQEVVPTA